MTAAVRGAVVVTLAGPPLLSVCPGLLPIERQQGGGAAGDQGAGQQASGGPNETLSGTRPADGSARHARG